MTLTGTGRWYTVGQYLVTAVTAGLTSSVGRAGQVPGEIAWDNCTCEGVLAVTVPRIYLAEEFPSEEEQPVGVRCQAPYEVGEFTVSVVRCAPQPDGDDLAPSAADLDAAAGLLLQDMTETMEAVSVLLCQLRDQEVIDDFMIAPAASAGPEGACVGFVLRVLVGLIRVG